MTNAIKHFVDLYGQDMLREVLVRTCNHLEDSVEKVPQGDEQQMYFSLLNMLDRECCKYGDAPKGLTEEMIKEFLLSHKKEIKCKPPTYIGLLSGVYDFLK